MTKLTDKQKFKYKEYYKNPRNLLDKEGVQLKEWLAEFGDLSGIVHEINTDEIISGNQRSKMIDIRNCEVRIVKRYDTPTKTGTVAQGFVIWNDEEYTYRQVDWTKEKCEKANIIANKAGGSWDFEILANDFEQDDLLGWGFESWEFAGSEQMTEDYQDDTDYSDKNKEFDDDDFEDLAILKLEFDLDTYNEVKTKLLKHGKTYEDAVCNLLKIEIDF